MILGRKGSGKTSMARWLSAHHSRLLIVDPHREYGDLAVEIADVDALPDYFAAADGRWRVCVHNDRLNDDFPALCNVVYAVGDCHFLVDEADWYCTPHTIPPEFDRLIKYGRHRQVTLGCISRRPSELHRNVTANAYRVFAFSLTEPRDLDYLRVYAGPDFTDALPDLPILEGRYRNLEVPDAPIQAVHLTIKGASCTFSPIDTEARGEKHALSRRVLPPASDDEGEAVDAEGISESA